MSNNHQDQGLSDLLFAQALRDCHAASRTFPFIAVILDCLNDRTKAFYQRWDFQELPGHPYRLYLSAATLATLMTKTKCIFVGIPTIAASSIEILLRPI